MVLGATILFAAPSASSAQTAGYDLKKVIGKTHAHVVKSLKATETFKRDGKKVSYAVYQIPGTVSCQVNYVNDIASEIEVRMLAKSYTPGQVLKLFGVDIGPKPTIYENGDAVSWTGETVKAPWSYVFVRKSGPHAWQLNIFDMVQKGIVPKNTRFYTLILRGQRQRRGSNAAGAG